MSQPIKSGSSNHTLKLKPIVLCVSAILGMTSMAHGEIINTNGAGVINQHNGPTIVNINKASDKGVSHNIYNKFDVDNKGVILNNSKDNVNTQLGGMINGNLNLAGGEAKVILNEVNSNNATTLNGMVEVAGKKAQVIVANPSGITCNSCGFINTESATLTTGKPIVTNGEILGYNVSKGQIIVNKNLTSNSPTELIARSAIINGQLAAKEIKVVTGNNFVDANGEVLSSVPGTGSRPSVAIDVSSLGGMYADKITLVSTEMGVGVSNQGIISAGNDGLSISSNGGLSNKRNRIESNGNIDVKASGISNDAIITARKNINVDINSGGFINNDGGKIISTDGSISLAGNSSVFNRYKGSIQAKNNVSISGETLQNGDGIIKAETGDINIDLTDTLYQWRNTANSHVEDRIIAGRDINIKASRIINENARIESGRDINLTLNSGLENTNSAVTAQRRIKVDADILTNKSSSITAKNAKSDYNITKYINNDAKSTISSGRGLNITSAKLINAGKIVSPTNVPNTVPVPTYASNIKVDNLENNGGSIAGDNLTITSNNISNTQGFIDGKTLKVTANTLSNNGGYIRSYNDMTLNVGHLSNLNSNNFSSVASRFALTNKVGGIEALNSGITVTGNKVSNYFGLFKSSSSEKAATSGGMEFKLTDELDNNNGQLISYGGINIDAKGLNNYKGDIYAGGRLDIKSASNINNYYGKLRSDYITTLYAPGISSYDTNGTYSLDGTGIIYKPNGLNIIHIKKPTDSGISHNTYQSFNVNEKGVIFNNSSTATDTLLGGNIFGNDNITAGKEASVILNEVIGNSMTTINGMMEVAGNAAQVIVANASGITCNSCGFINATRGAFVTGTPIVVGQNLVGYNVSKGEITVNNNLTSNSVVDFISRAVLVNGNVKANELNITTGSNFYDANGNIISSITGPYNQKNYGVTVAANGSLNAEKMNININDSNTGLFNKGVINAGNQGLNVKAGAINNTGTIQSRGNIDLAANSTNSFSNDYGTIISSNGDVNISSNGTLLNRYNGLIKANQNVNINTAQDIQNSNGLIHAEKGNINVNADTIYNWAGNNSKYGKYRFTAGQDIVFNVNRLINEQAIISAGRDFTFTGKSLDNKASSALYAKRRMTIDTNILNNLSSTMKTENGRMDITAYNSVVNDSKSVISSEKLLNITSPKLTNNGVISSNNDKSTFKVNNLVNNAGYIKGFNLNFISQYLNNSNGLIKADNNLVMNADYISNTNSSDFSRYTYNLGLPSQKGGIVTNNGNIKIKGIQMNNTSGIVQTNALFPAPGEADIDVTLSNELINNYAQINSAGNMNIQANSISNYNGAINAGINLTVKGNSSINNAYGRINSNGTTQVNTPLLSNSYGKITGGTVIINK